MAEPVYPDRDKWPEYWRGIRFVAATLAVAIPTAVLITLLAEPMRELPEPWNAIGRAALFVLGYLAIAAAARSITATWSRWLDHR